MMYKERLEALRDDKNADFVAKLVPTKSPDLFMGVRTPAIRKLAKEISKEGNYESFLRQVPHKYFDEDLLHGLIICEIKDYDLFVEELEMFFPYIDNWAVCDSMKPVCFKKNKERLENDAIIWAKASEIYKARFGIEVLMSHFLDDDFKKEHLKFVSEIRSEEYYLRMMQAWYFATALAKKWDETIPYFEKQTLDSWTHNKALQKGIESLRLSEEQKNYLRSLKIK